jgi:hypothetical protein
MTQSNINNSILRRSHSKILLSMSRMDGSTRAPLPDSIESTSGIKGLTGEQVGVGSSEDISGGYSINHCALTMGFLWACATERFSAAQQPDFFRRTYAHVSKETWDFLMREVWERGYSKEIAEAILASRTNSGRPPVDCAATTITPRCAVPRFRISPRNGLYDLDEIPHESDDYATAPYEMTFLEPPDQEFSKAIIHRVPYLDDRPWSWSMPLHRAGSLAMFC